MDIIFTNFDYYCTSITVKNIHETYSEFTATYIGKSVGTICTSIKQLVKQYSAEHYDTEVRYWFERATLECEAKACTLLNSLTLQQLFKSYDINIIGVYDG